MREDFKLLTGLLAAFQSATVPAVGLLPDTFPTSPDPTFGIGGLVSRTFVGAGERAFKVRTSGENSFVAGTRTVSGMSTGFVAKFDSFGNLVPQFGTNGTLSVPGFGINSMAVAGSRAFAVGTRLQNSTVTAAMFAFNVDTGQPIPGCGDASGYYYGIPHTYQSATFFDVNSWYAGGDEADLGNWLQRAVMVEFNSQQNDFRASILSINAATCSAQTDFGTNGYLYIDGDFYANHLSPLPDGGTIVVGLTQVPGSANLSAAVFHARPDGTAGNCGTAVKSIYAVPGLNVGPGGGFFAPTSQTYNIFGYIQPANTFYMRQLQPDCTLNDVIYTYPGGAGVPTAGNNVTATTNVVVVNEFVGSQYVSKVALYDNNGGAPIGVSPPFQQVPITPVQDGGPRASKQAAIVGSVGYGVAVRPDAKILVAGQTTANGGASMLARYIGVETTTNVIEFHNINLDHYFVTADPVEAAAVDGGAAGPGWSRTGETWKSGGPDRVCRFYGTPDINPATGTRRGPNSHFYTIDSAECAQVKQDPGWRFESYDYSGWPKIGGSCPAGTIPVQRVYNGRFAQNDSNHRYLINSTKYSQMIVQGWNGEGTVFCAVL